MGGKVFYAAFCIGLTLVSVRGTNGKTCWEGPWFNNTSPTLHNGTDSETQTTAELQSICPDGSPVMDAHCKDEKGEPFRIFKNDTANKYVATCTVVTGLQCKPYNDTPGAACADFAIQYGCTCPTTAATTVIHTTINVAISGSSVPSGSGGSGSGAGSGTGGSGSGGLTTSKSGITTDLGVGGAGSATFGGGSGTGGLGTGVNGSGTSKGVSFVSTGGSGSSPGSNGSGASGSVTTGSGISSRPNIGTTTKAAGSGSSSSGSGSSSGGTSGGTGGSGSGGSPAGNGSGGTQNGNGSGGNGQGQSLGSKGCTCKNGSEKYRPSMFLFLLFAILKCV